MAGVEKPDDALAEALRDAYAVGSAGKIEQEPAFGVRQVVDIALKALSPGINDATTGVMCVQHLGAILEAVGRRDIPDRIRAKDGPVRLIARGRTFATIVRLSLDPIRLCAGANVAVRSAIFQAISYTARQTADDVGRLASLREQARLRAAVAVDTLDYDYDTVRQTLARRAA